MRFVTLLLEEAGGARRKVVFSTIIAGIAMGSVMTVINTVSDSSKSESGQLELLGLFILSCGLFLFAKGVALRITSEIVESILNRMRVRFATKIAKLSLTAFEQVGRARVYTALTRDVQTLSEAGTMVIHGATSSVMLIFSALYIAYLSLFAFAVTLGLFGTAIYVYRLSQRDSAELWRQANEAEAGFHDGLGHLLDGFKEVKMSTRRSDDLLVNHLVIQSQAAEELKTESGRRFNKGSNITNLFFYMLLGTLVFLLPQNAESAEVATKVIYVIIFIGSAMEIVLKALPMLAKANVSLQTLQELESELDGKLQHVDGPASSPRPEMREIEAKGLFYTYREPDSRHAFTAGPLDFRIAAGEIVFIVGGNGSGKSTMVKLLTRLYEPSAGIVLWDGVEVGRDNAAEYRNLFSVVFSDFHLFDRLYGVDAIEPAQVDALLAEMDLARKTAYVHNRFSTLDLSSGQRKRLAMVVSRLEDKPVCVFDEWAADQDPDFRRHYYEVLLPALRAEGRAVIAVSHDDRYFHVADRVVHMEEGKIVRVDDRR